MNEINYFNPFQSEFRPNHGTEKALITLVDDLRQKPDVNSASILALLDFSVVFDTINYPLLQDLDLGNAVLHWFSLVFIGSERSSPWLLFCGIS